MIHGSIILGLVAIAVLTVILYWKNRVEIEENTLGNTPVKTLPIVNKPSLDLLSCDIKRGNDLGLNVVIYLQFYFFLLLYIINLLMWSTGHFYIVTTKNGECELRTNGQKLDYETKPYHKLIVTLITNSTYLGIGKFVTLQIFIFKIDFNYLSWLYFQICHVLLQRLLSTLRTQMIILLYFNSLLHLVKSLENVMLRQFLVTRQLSPLLPKSLYAIISIQVARISEKTPVVFEMFLGLVCVIGPRE